MSGVAAQAQVPTQIPPDIKALIDRYVSEKLAEQADEITVLKRRIETLENRLAGTVPKPGPPPAPDETSSQNAHTIQEGETLSSIARLYQITAPQLARANGMALNQPIFPGKQLVIPNGGTSQGPAPVPSPPTPSPEGYYTVQAGDSLTRIAAANGMTVNQLMNLNGLTDPNLITEGQRLKLSGTASAEELYYYEVEQGDTLFSIAETFFTSVNHLLKINDLPQGTAIRPGQQLLVPTAKYFEFIREDSTAEG